ncbi:radical SAM protein [bacterium]|nr:radical SAM protein [bacterium]
MRNLYIHEKKYLRFRSNENVLEELRIGKEKYNYRSVLFHDDNLITRKKKFCEFMEEYKKEIGVPYMVIVHPKNIDKEIAKILKNTNCAYVSMGIQTLDEKCRKEILNRHETNEEIIEALKILKEEKIHVVVDHIFNLPDEKDEELITASRFYNEHRPNRIVSYNLTYYPTTEIAGIAREKGVITERMKLMENGAPLTYFDSKGDKKENRVRFNSFRNIFSLIPFVPRGIIEFFLKEKRYHLLSRVPFFITGILPNVFRALRGKEVKAHQMIVVFLYNLLKMGY